jgi:hypothetical protein
LAGRRWYPLSGIVFVVVALIGVIAVSGSTPGSDASAAKVKSFYDAHNLRQGVSAFVIAASVPFLIVFANELLSRATVNGQRTLWERLLKAGSTLTAGAVAALAFIHFATADAGDNASAEAAQALNVLDNNSWMLLNTVLGVMMLGAGATILATGAAPRLLGWVAFTLGVLLFIPFADFFALLVSLIWIIVTSIVLYRSEPAATPGARGQPSGAAG